MAQAAAAIVCRDQPHTGWYICGGRHPFAPQVAGVIERTGKRAAVGRSKACVYKELVSPLQCVGGRIFGEIEQTQSGQGRCVGFRLPTLAQEEGAEEQRMRLLLRLLHQADTVSRRLPGVVGKVTLPPLPAGHGEAGKEEEEVDGGGEKGTVSGVTGQQVIGRGR
ncbi:MAG: hypothetical protein LUC18_02440 [Porphyromonadaceae bacterium]|nr:hypothetical protein [Porphyromonadaceae bacterium]